tara:strand:- start:1729 stop:2028 length:300 start_codon:yes stop_codon:yes gene_type:complete
MNIKNTIIEHYRKFFDLHAKGITLDEDDHLNIDWAEGLVENCFIPNVRESIINYTNWLSKQNLMICEGVDEYSFRSSIIGGKKYSAEELYEKFVSEYEA